MTDGPSREGDPRSRQAGRPVTGVSPERAAYEMAAALFATGAIGVPVLPWVELDRDERDGWAKIRQATLGFGDLQVGGNLVSPQPDKWWCDCDDMVGPHVHCVFGGRGPHKHAVEVPPDHREPKRGSRG